MTAPAGRTVAEPTRPSRLIYRCRQEDPMTTHGDLPAPTEGLARGFHDGTDRRRVDQLKSAPDLRKCGLSRPTSAQLKEHLPGEADYRVLSPRPRRHGQGVRGGSGRWGATDPDGAVRRSRRRVVGGARALA